MPERVFVIGAGSHARSVINLLEVNQLAVESIYDDSFRPGTVELISGYPLLGNFSAASGRKQLVLAVGDNMRRKELFEQFGADIYQNTIFHPSARAERTAKAGKANLVFANAYINAEAIIGDNNIINTGCIIEHECRVGSHCHISIGALLAGRVSVGDFCFIGAGAVIKDKVLISDHVTVGAGAVVVKNITEPGVYVGNPAKKIK